MQIVTDPKLALEKAKDLWSTLSLPEPGNQARPENLEQLLVLFTRETARRIVHLVNGTAILASRIPRRFARALIRISQRMLELSDATIKVKIDSFYQIFKIFVQLTQHEFVKSRIKSLVPIEPLSLKFTDVTSSMKSMAPFEPMSLKISDAKSKLEHIYLNGGASTSSANEDHSTLSLIAKVQFLPFSKITVNNDFEQSSPPPSRTPPINRTLRFPREKTLIPKCNKLQLLNNPKKQLPMQPLFRRNPRKSGLTKDSLSDKLNGSSVSQADICEELIITLRTKESHLPIIPKIKRISSI